MLSLESSHRGDSNEYTQYTIFNIKKKITLNYSTSEAMGFFPRVRISRGKGVISVRASEVLLYFEMCTDECSSFVNVSYKFYE